MDVIPVIDIKDGIVVHARRGARADYRPIETPLSVSADPVAVVDGVLSCWPFDQIYVADLDAIAGRPGNGEAVSRIARSHPRLRIWLDAGFSEPGPIERMLREATVDIVLATEALASEAAYAHLRGIVPAERALLSLDRAGDRRLGCTALFELPDAWPDRVIDMNLARVGAAEGPDWTSLAHLQRLAPRRRIYVAGGVRDDDDLERLAQQRIGGALVATALHAGALTRMRIEAP